MNLHYILLPLSIIVACNLCGCSKGFVPGTTAPPPPPPPTAHKAHVAAAPKTISSPALQATMKQMNERFMTIMTSVGDPAKLPDIADNAQALTSSLAKIKYASKDEEFQALADTAKSAASDVARKASGGQQEEAMKSAAKMIHACESCHEVYRKKGKLLSGP